MGDRYVLIILPASFLSLSSFPFPFEFLKSPSSILIAPTSTTSLKSRKNVSAPRDSK